MITALFLAVFIIAAASLFFGSKTGISLANFAWKVVKCFLYLYALLVLISSAASFFANEETKPAAMPEGEPASVSVNLN